MQTYCIFFNFQPYLSKILNIKTIFSDFFSNIYTLLSIILIRIQQASANLSYLFVRILLWCLRYEILDLIDIAFPKITVQELMGVTSRSYILGVVSVRNDKDNPLLSKPPKEKL